MALFFLYSELLIYSFLWHQERIAVTGRNIILFRKIICLKMASNSRIRLFCAMTMYEWIIWIVLASHESIMALPLLSSPFSMRICAVSKFRPNLCRKFAGQFDRLDVSLSCGCCGSATLPPSREQPIPTDLHTLIQCEWHRIKKKRCRNNNNMRLNAFKNWHSICVLECVYGPLTNSVHPPTQQFNWQRIEENGKHGLYNHFGVLNSYLHKRPHITHMWMFSAMYHPVGLLNILTPACDSHKHEK